jgi:hypothetical protein
MTRVAAVIHLVLVECAVLNVLGVRRQARRWTRRRGHGTAARLLRRLQVMVDLLVVQHLIEEVALEVITGASMPGSHDVSSTRTVHQCSLVAYTQRALRLHSVIVLEATRVLRPERRHPLLPIDLVRVVRDALLAGLRVLHASDLIIAAYVTRIVLTIILL